LATKLFLRNTQTNGLTPTDGDVVWFDLLPTAGASAATVSVSSVGGATERQFLNGGSNFVGWITGRVPSGGFTLTTTDISAWFRESNIAANCGGRYRLFKRTAAGVITELAGGPFDDGVEFTTSDTEYTWVGNPTDTVFAEDDRLLVRPYITNIGTMGDLFTCTLTFNGADTTTGDSFLNLAETVAFKAETNPAAALSGTATSGMTEADVVAGGKVLTITLTDTTWLPAT
jgi:hypothetical protein